MINSVALIFMSIPREGSGGGVRSFDTSSGALETWSESRSASSATELLNASTLTG
jgi:hypothetical protein